MSNTSGTSTARSTGPRGRGKVFGIPRKCWCDEGIVALNSHSEANPYRRYYRCCYAAGRKLKDDDHLFKWVDQATLEEVERLNSALGSIETELKEIRSNLVVPTMGNVEDQCQKMRLMIETDILGRVDYRLDEVKSSIFKLIIRVLICCLVIVVVWLS